MLSLAQFKSNRKNEIVGFLLLALAAIIFLSLVSYSPFDTPAHTSAPNSPVRNLVGIIGAYIAEALTFVVGLAAYLLPFVLLIWAWNIFWGKTEKEVYLKLIGLIIMLVSIGALAHTFNLSVEGSAFRAGGVMGPYAADTLGSLFGLMGARVVIFTFLIIAILLTTDFLFFSFALKGGTFLAAGMIKAGRLVYETLTGNTEVPGGLSLSFKKKPPNVTKTRKKLELKKKPALALKQREEIKINEPKKIESVSKLKAKVEKRKPRPIPEPAKTARPTSRPSKPKFDLPPISLLDLPEEIDHDDRRQTLEEMSELLESTLETFGVEAQVVEISQGPAVTRFELKLAPGIKVSKVLALSDDLALALEAYRVRIEAPIPGKAAVGIEVPNRIRENVCLREVIDSNQFHSSRSKLTIALGKTITGDPLVADLASMPHLLIAGATGSGKTVCVNSLIASIIYNCAPEDVRFMMIDPKVVELSPYNGIPHLLWPVITEAKEAGKYLHWLVNEMEERYRILAKAGARNIETYNDKASRGLTVPSDDGAGEEPLQALPYIVTVIDELADLMMVASIEVEDAIMRLAQLARAVGIHLVLATQRPSVDVITGVIKANFPARLSFQVSSRVDSRTVLDMNGAEKLIGNGDLLYLPAGSSKPTRAQGVFITDYEIERIVEFLTAQRDVEYLDPEKEALEEAIQRPSESTDDYTDPLYEKAVRLVLSTEQASISMIQRRMRVGYARAARLIDMMELDGIVGPSQGSQARELLVGPEYIHTLGNE